MVARQEAPWGYHEVIQQGSGFVLKRLVIQGGEAISLQLHRFRTEFWYVQSGHGRAIVRNGHFNVYPGGTVLIPPLTVHRLTNLHQDEPLVIIELQVGTPREDDIVRLEDRYGREGNESRWEGR